MPENVYSAKVIDTPSLDFCGVDTPEGRALGADDLCIQEVFVGKVCDGAFADAEELAQKRTLGKSRRDVGVCLRIDAPCGAICPAHGADLLGNVPAGWNVVFHFLREEDGGGISAIVSCCRCGRYERK